MRMTFAPSLSLTRSLSHSPSCSCTRTPSGIAKTKPKRVVCAFAWQRYARQINEPRRTPGQGREPKPLDDRTLPGQASGLAGTRHQAVRRIVC